jgi:hypothetical protein
MAGAINNDDISERISDDYQFGEHVHDLRVGRADYLCTGTYSRDRIIIIRRHIADSEIYRVFSRDFDSSI